MDPRPTAIKDHSEAPAVITAYTLLVGRPIDRVGRSCSSKIPYMSGREARARVRGGRNQDGTLRPYHCQFCDRWHLGHVSQRHYRLEPRHASLAFVAPHRHHMPTHTLPIRDASNE